MNESFADLAGVLPNLKLSADPLPFYHSLTKNTVKGTMISPVTGGGTANVEFEYLTGDSLAFLPSSTVAYQLYLYDGAPSLVSSSRSRDTDHRLSPLSGLRLEPHLRLPLAGLSQAALRRGRAESP
jgi:hypothetical protein